MVRQATLTSPSLILALVMRMTGRGVCYADSPACRGIDYAYDAAYFGNCSDHFEGLSIGSRVAFCA